MEIRWREGIKRMKLLFLNYEFPPLGGGAGNATKNLAYAFTQSGHEVTVITTWFKGLNADEVCDGYRILRVRSRRKRLDRSNTMEMLSYVFHARRRASRLMHEEGAPDAVICFFALPTGLVAFHLRKRFGIPYILSLRGGDVPGFLPDELGLLHQLTAPLSARIWKYASHIVANSRGLQELAEHTATRFGKRVAYIPNGVDAETFRPALRPPDTFTILHVGRLTAQKGTAQLLEALRILHDDAEHEAFRCIIAGDGPLRVELERQAQRLDLGKHIVFLGWVGRAELPALYRRASVFVLPTAEEGMANVILEAMASGLPIITTNARGNEELVEDGVNGVLLSSREPATIAAALRLFQDDSARTARTGQEGRKRSMQYSWQASATQYIDTLSRI